MMQISITAIIQGPTGIDFEYRSNFNVIDRNSWMRSINAVPTMDFDGLISVAIESCDGCAQSFADVPLSYPQADLVALVEELIQDIVDYESREERLKQAHTRALRPLVACAGETSPSTPNKIYG